MKELNSVFAWRERESEVLFFDIVCIDDFFVDVFDSLHEACL